MNVLYVSKASLVTAYQAKLHALAQHVTIDAVVPTRWDALTGTPCPEGNPRVRTEPIRLQGRNHFHYYADVASVFNGRNADLLHMDEEPYSAVTFQLTRASRAARIPCLFFAWQNLHKRLPPPFSFFRSYVFRHAAAGIAGTDAAADVLRQAGWRGMLEVIPQMGVSAETFAPNAQYRDSLRASLGLDDRTLVIGYAGRLLAEKGVDQLLAASREIPNAVVLVVGDGPARSHLERLAADLGMSARTRFIGHIESLDMPRWYNAMDMLVLPSRTTRGWSEQFGRVLIEAMACGVPPIGSRTGEIPHVIGDAGLLFDDGDVQGLRSAILQLARHDVHDRLSALGRERVLDRYTNDLIARRTCELYERVAGQS